MEYGAATTMEVTGTGIRGTVRTKSMDPRNGLSKPQEQTNTIDRLFDKVPSGGCPDYWSIPVQDLQGGHHGTAETNRHTGKYLQQASFHCCTIGKHDSIGMHNDLQDTRMCAGLRYEQGLVLAGQILNRQMLEIRRF